MAVIPFQRKGGWDAATVARPWDTSRPAIHAWLLEHFDPESGRIPAEKMILPDTPPRRPGQVIGSAPGAERHVLTDHVPPGGTKEGFFIGAVQGALSDREAFGTLYDAIIGSGALRELLSEDYSRWETDGIRPPVFVQRLAASDIDRESIASLARMLATEAPDTPAIDFALALMRVFPSEDAADVAHVLGRHDAFTKKAIAVLAAVSDDVDQALWALAREVHDWGRVYCVQRLWKSGRDDIREWLLFEGHRTEALPSYVTQMCAERGNLVERLRASRIEPRLLEATGRIVVESFQEGEHCTIDRWDDGREIVERYVDHAGRMTFGIAELNDLLDLQAILTKGKGWTTIHVGRSDEEMVAMALAKRPWTDDIRAPMIAGIADMLDRPDWSRKLHEAVASETVWPGDLYRVVQTANRLGVDCRPDIVERVERGDDLWAYLFLSDDGSRIDDTLGMAERLLPLDELDSMPRDTAMQDDDYRLWQGLWDVVANLRDHPGKSWRFVKTALEGPADNCRHSAIFVLERWGEANWPPGVRLALERARRIEEVPNLRDKMQGTLNGRMPFDPSAPFISEEDLT